MTEKSKSLEWLRGAATVLALLGFECRQDLSIQDTRHDYIDFDRYGEDYDDETHGRGCLMWTLSYDCEEDSWYLTCGFNKEDGNHPDPFWSTPKSPTFQDVLGMIHVSIPQKLTILDRIDDLTHKSL